MNFFRAIRDHFWPQPKLRNKPGGLAMIRAPKGDCANVLNGRIVRTVKADADGFWTVNPEQILRGDSRAVIDASGRRHRAGVDLVVVGFSDAALEPLPEQGITQEEVDSLYEPTKEPANA